MVDPASSSSSSTQQQNAVPLPVTITVMPIDLLDDVMDQSGGGGEQHGGENESYAVEDQDSSCDGPDSSGRFSLRQLGHQYLARPLSEAALIRLAQSLYEEVVDEVVLGIVFEEHRGAKLGLTALLENGSNCMYIIKKSFSFCSIDV